MKNRKGLKHYAIMFAMATLALIVYTIYLRLTDDDFDSSILLGLLYVPIVFTLFLFTFDRLFEKIFSGKKKNVNVKYNTYIRIVSNAIENECEFSIEGYKRLRNDPKFQKGLGQAFRVYDNGENEDLNYEFLERKFKKGTDEYTAFQVVINEVKKMMGN